jgi:hypothetical protein
MMKQKPVDGLFLKTIVAVLEIALDPRSSKRERHAAVQTLAFFHGELDMDHLRAAWRVLHRAPAAPSKPPQPPARLPANRPTAAR